MEIIGVFIAVLLPSLACLVGTELIRRYALRTSMVDIPNHRSSHTVPTPRGGGIAIAFSVLATVAVLLVLLPSQRNAAIGILGGGLAVAVVGLLDDRFDLSAKSRLLVQFAGAFWLLFWIGPLQLEIMSFDLRWLATLAAGVLIVWSTNLFNFMDGLDGFAGSQSLVAASAGAFICFRQDDTLLSLMMFATAGASAGFLVWNWPPAQIFMGDCGSGFLGFLFGSFVILGHQHGSLPFAAGLVLFLVFFADSTLTLLRRMLVGEKWYSPHRTHAYQLATRLGATHRTVTMAATAMFVVAATLALSVSTGSKVGMVAAICYATLICSIWMLVNRIFVGRQNALASITQSRPVESADVTDVIVYLRFRQLQTRASGWRSVMAQKDLLAEATGVASKLGYNVSHDWLEGCGGGRCEAAGEKWILLDFNMSKQEQTRQILLAIHEEIGSVDSLSPSLRLALNKAVARQYTPSPLPKAA